MVQQVMSLLLGMLPEIIYFTYFLIYSKNIKTNKVKLFGLIFISYIVCIAISRFKIIYYLGFIFLVCIVLKILYKDNAQIIDVFTFSISTIYLSLVGFICSRFINNSYTAYYLSFIANRILIFLPFIFKSKFNIIYRKYCSLWNRNDEIKTPIKSITLRNISLITLNSFIVLLNIATIYVINTFE